MATSFYGLRQVVLDRTTEPEPGDLIRWRLRDGSYTQEYRWSAHASVFGLFDRQMRYAALLVDDSLTTEGLADRLELGDQQVHAG